MKKSQHLKIKVCGMKFPGNIREVAALHPDYLGFIFFEASPRNFDAEIPEIPQNIKRTGVFVNASLEFILEKSKKHDLDAVQLHGEEPPELCEVLKTNYRELIKVFSVGPDFNFKKLQVYEGKVDFFLFDTKGEKRGGTGKAFNWEILRDYPSKTPFFLSGGIGLEALKTIKNLNLERLYGIDVNSKFEISPGQKNEELLKKLITAIRT